MPGRKPKLHRSKKMVLESNVYMRRTLAIWLLIILAESVHGLVRQVTLVHLVGDFAARQVSVFTGSALIFLIAWFSIRWINPPDLKASFVIGLVWVLLTVVFEVGLGMMVFGYTSGRILEDYNVSNGGMMVFGLVLMFLSPVIAARFRMQAKGFLSRSES